jgi:hypothetical protein
VSAWPQPVPSDPVRCHQIPTAADVAGCYDRAGFDNDVELVQFDLGVPGVEGGFVGDGWFSTDGTCTDGGFGSNKLWLIAEDQSSAEADCDAVTGSPGSPLQPASGWGLALDHVFICS